MTWRGCDGKVRHKSKSAAVLGMNLLRQRRSDHQRRGRQLNVYSCPRCGAWHIGNIPVPMPRNSRRRS